MRRDVRRFRRGRTTIRNARPVRCDWARMQTLPHCYSQRAQALGSLFPPTTRVAQRSPSAPAERKEWIGRRDVQRATCSITVTSLTVTLDGVNGGKRHIILERLFCALPRMPKSCRGLGTAKIKDIDDE